MKRTTNKFNPERVVNVYWNLHRHCWSVRQGGRVVGHAQYIALENVTWRVQASGRERVRREGKKNVHAYASGRVTGLVVFDGSEMPVRYNPYDLETFVAGDTPLFTSRFAAFQLRSGNRPHTLTCGINLGA